MEACADPFVKAIVTAIGDDDGVRLLLYVDFDVLHTYVLTDRERILQIGNNLLPNAIEFTENGGVYLPIFTQ